jgi:hypothetical protein
MSRSDFRHLRLFTPLAAAAALSLGTLPTLAQTAPSTTDCSAIRFELANPSPGSRLEPGALVLQGIAVDQRAGQGLGIDRVDFFLDSRELGGLNVGSAAPGAVPGPFGFGSFQTTITLPDETGGHDLFAYARSSVSGVESVLSIPVAIGTDPEDDTATTSTATCAGGTGGTTSATTTATTPTEPVTTTTTPSTPTTTLRPSSSTISVTVGNPSEGAMIKVGAYSVQGDAFDRAAASGTGIDRIDIFLDDRDTGGMLLGQATMGPGTFWQALVDLPTNQTGLHELWFYAHSSVNDTWTAVSVPVTIEK